MINAAAYTAVDRAEDEEPHWPRGSTDAPPPPWPQPAPRSAYRWCMSRPITSSTAPATRPGGRRMRPRRSTLMGAPSSRAKRRARGRRHACHPAHLVGVFGPWQQFRAHHAAPVRKPRRRCRGRRSGRRPDARADIATACRPDRAPLKADPAKSGTYHFRGPRCIVVRLRTGDLRAAGRAVTVTGIPTAIIPPRRRARCNSRLDCTATAAAFGIARPDWRAGLRADILAELREVSST